MDIYDERPAENSKPYLGLEFLVLILTGLVLILNFFAPLDIFLPQKKSFADGVTRLGNILGQSVVLSVAHQIRNTLVHSTSGVAWPLRRE